MNVVFLQHKNEYIYGILALYLFIKFDAQGAMI